ncbi:MAG: nitroreductase family protein [Carboxydocellales bacterium]
MTKDVMDAIRERRSIRNFSSDTVDEFTVGRILEAGASAPSAGNIQPWTFYAVFRQQVKEQLEAAAFNQKFIANAPVVIVVCALPEDAAARYGERGRSLYCLQDTAAATQNILLAADAFGLGSCWVGAFDESAVFNALNCQPGERPVAVDFIKPPVLRAARYRN